MPELPELQAHAERLTGRFAAAVLEEFRPLAFTALKTASPDPAAARGEALVEVGRRGKYLLATFGALTFVVHLMQGGRLKEDPKPSARPRTGVARWRFTDGRAWLLTEAGTERRAGVWCVPTADRSQLLPLADLGPQGDRTTVAQHADRFAGHNQRLHGFLRDQTCVAGLGRRLANEVCHRARLSPFAMTGRLGRAGAEAVVDAIAAACAEGLAVERTRNEMSASADRPGGVHGRTGLACPVCGDTIREVAYSSYTVHYCPTCQTGGKVLADNTTSRFLR
jgi:formamidopyrimidine-DNA glycosylase